MKTFNQYVQEHNPLAVKSIVKKINPLDKQMRKLKSLRKRGITGAVKDALVKSITGKRPKPGATKAVKDEIKAVSKRADKLEAELEKERKEKRELQAQIPGNLRYTGT